MSELRRGDLVCFGDNDCYGIVADIESGHAYISFILNHVNWSYDERGFAPFTIEYAAKHKLEVPHERA